MDCSFVLIGIAMDPEAGLLHRTKSQSRTETWIQSRCDGRRHREGYITGRGREFFLDEQIFISCIVMPNLTLKINCTVILYDCR